MVILLVMTLGVEKTGDGCKVSVFYFVLYNNTSQNVILLSLTSSYNDCICINNIDTTLFILFNFLPSKQEFAV